MSQHKFEKISFDKLTENLNSFKKSGDVFIKVWQKDHKSWQAKLRNIDRTDEKLVVTLLIIGKTDIVKDQPILLNFTNNGMDFFAETSFENLEQNVVSLKINHKIYMFEKRKNPRYLCFPEHKAYFVIDIPTPKKDDANVIIFDKEKREEGDFLKKFKEKVNSEDVQLKDGFFTLKFRILDISKEGLSLFTSKEEYEFYKLENLIKSGYVLVNERIYNVEINDVSYVVDYISPDRKSIPMFKIGLKIAQDNVLNEYLNSLNRSDKIITQQEKEFEDI